MRKTMLDLETLGTKPGCAVLQIGAAHSSGSKFEVTIDVWSCLHLGLTIDADTVRWWHESPIEQRDYITAQERIPLVEALQKFSTWFLSVGVDDELWALGASFDFPLLEAAYEAAGLQVPWNYRQLRCARTVLALVKTHGWVPTPRNTAHTALRDSLDQLSDLEEALTWLNPHRALGAL